jgi:hypothetical protein
MLTIKMDKNKLAQTIVNLMNEVETLKSILDPTPVLDYDVAKEYLNRVMSGCNVCLLDLINSIRIHRGLEMLTPLQQQVLYSHDRLQTIERLAQELMK